MGYNRTSNQITRNDQIIEEFSRGSESLHRGRDERENSSHQSTGVMGLVFMTAWLGSLLVICISGWLAWRELYLYSFVLSSYVVCRGMRVNSTRLASCRLPRGRLVRCKLSRGNDNVHPSHIISHHFHISSTLHRHIEPKQVSANVSTVSGF
ncbi:hypothetical protein BKA65DRAFT_231153 [Rhexocercosporidium sp. MPI-PUGE-AT-0058]|nr:hypothetical protein BKA65DRAFT_231153 [Rhexocercosporidium sp. MPI-PUGE-AT-0058]